MSSNCDTDSTPVQHHATSCETAGPLVRHPWFDARRRCPDGRRPLLTLWWSRGGLLPSVLPTHPWASRRRQRHGAPCGVERVQQMKGNLTSDRDMITV